MTTTGNVTSDVAVMPMHAGPFSVEPTPSARPETPMHAAAKSTEMVERLKTTFTNGCDAAVADLNKKTKRSKIVNHLGRSMINAGISVEMLELMKANVHTAMPTSSDVTDETCWQVRTPVKPTTSDGAMFQPNFSGADALDMSKGIAGMQFHFVFSLARSTFKITCVDVALLLATEKTCPCLVLRGDRQTK